MSQIGALCSFVTAKFLLDMYFLPVAVVLSLGG